LNIRAHRDTSTARLSAISPSIHSTATRNRVKESSPTTSTTNATPELERIPRLREPKFLPGGPTREEAKADQFDRLPMVGTQLHQAVPW
jgi:hypothetical protein